MEILQQFEKEISKTGVKTLWNYWDIGDYHIEVRVVDISGYWGDNGEWEFRVNIPQVNIAFKDEDLPELREDVKEIVFKFFEDTQE